MTEIVYQCRYALPLWLVTLITAWLPDNRISIRIRGLLVSLVLKKCGRNLTLGRDVTLLGIDKLSLGHDVYIAKGSWINALGGVTFEDEVVLAPYVVVASTNHGFRDNSVRFGGTHPAPVKIGRGTWLASHVTVCAGVNIGAGNLVAANAVVTRDSNDNVVLGGIPATELTTRTDNPSPYSTRSDVKQS